MLIFEFYEESFRTPGSQGPPMVVKTPNPDKPELKIED
jgi:hypothetical protein